VQLAPLVRLALEETLVLQVQLDRPERLAHREQPEPLALAETPVLLAQLVQLVRLVLPVQQEQQEQEVPLESLEKLVIQEPRAQLD